MARLCRLLLCASVVTGRGSLADGFRRSVRFDYVRLSGAEQCPEMPAVAAAVRARLGYDPFRERADDTVAVVLSAGSAGLRADIRAYDVAGRSQGTRRIESSNRDCVELADTVVLAVAITIDPEAALALSPREPRAPREPRDPQPRPVQAVTSPVTPRLGLSGHAAIGSAPAWAAGVAALAGLMRERLSANLEIRADLPASRQVEGGEIRSWFVLGTLLGCVHGRVLAGCAVAGGGALRIEGRDLVRAGGGTTPWATAGARAALEFPIRPRLSAVARADLLFALTRTTAQVSGREVWESPRVSGTVGAGVLVNFP